MEIDVDKRFEGRNEDLGSRVVHVVAVGFRSL